MSASQDIVIAGFGGSAIERRSERGLMAFATDAVVDLLHDARITKDQIDGYVGAPWATNQGAVHAEGGDEVSAKAMVRSLGLGAVKYVADLYRGYAPDMVATGWTALRSGACRYVLGLRALYRLDGADYGLSSSELAYGEDQFKKPFGYTTAGARFAIRAQRYMATHGIGRTDLYEVVAQARRHAARNPLAIFKDVPLSLESYLAARPIATPHGLFDCDMPVCGAAAFLMCRHEDLPAGAMPAHVAGWSGSQNPEQVFSMSGITPRDVATFQTYDGFSSMIFEWIEAFGLCEPGGTCRFLRDGHGDLDGRLPINTFGGSLGEGRLHGMGHLREAYLQATGKAGARQAARSGPALVQVGPYDDSSFVLLQPERVSHAH